MFGIRSGLEAGMKMHKERDMKKLMKIAALAAAVALTFAACDTSTNTEDDDTAATVTAASYVADSFGSDAVIADATDGKGAFTYDSGDDALVITSDSGIELWAEVVYDADLDADPDTTLDISANTTLTFDYKASSQCTGYIQDSNNDMWLVNGWGGLVAMDEWTSVTMTFATASKAWGDTSASTMGSKIGKICIGGDAVTGIPVVFQIKNVVIQ